MGPETNNFNYDDRELDRADDEGMLDTRIADPEYDTGGTFPEDFAIEDIPDEDLSELAGPENF